MTITPNKRRFAIGFYLLTGWTTWGVELKWGGPPHMSNCGGEWIMCCGHVMQQAEVDAWKDAGLAIDGEPDGGGRATIVAGPNLSRWVSSAWHDMRARRWRRPTT